jgi:hypothetical protein
MRRVVEEPDGHHLSEAYSLFSTQMNADASVFIRRSLIAYMIALAIILFDIMLAASYRHYNIFMWF